jgi:hypothetical protein
LKKNAAILILLALGLGALLGEAAWGLSLQNPPWAWPVFSRGGFWAAGAAGGLIWAGLSLLLAYLWFPETRAAWLAGLRGAVLGLLPGLLAPAWPKALGVPIPAPHNLPYRKVQIFLAALLMAGLALQAAASIWALARDREFGRRGALSRALRLGGLAWLLYTATGVWTGTWMLTGDAPVYLLITQSLSRDHDLDLKNDYAEQRWRRFYERELQVQEPAQADGRQISEHKPLWPLLLTPGYRFAGMPGALWVAAALAALAASLLFLWLLHWGFTGRQAIAGWAFLVFSPAWWTNSQSLMSDACAGLLFVAAGAALAGALPWTLGAAMAALLPWLGLRLYGPSFLLMLAFAWAARRIPWRAAAAAAAWAGSLGLALALNASHFGGVNPVASYDQRALPIEHLFQLHRLPHNFGAILFDQEYGWLFYAPAFALAFLALPLWWKRRREWLLTAGPALLGYFGLLMAIPWSIGDFAPARYLVPLAPFFALGLAEAWRHWGARAGFAALLALQSAWAVAMVALPWLCFSKGDGRNTLLKVLGQATGLNLTGIFPAFMIEKPSSTLWVLAALAAGAFFYLKARPKTD